MLNKARCKYSYKQEQEDVIFASTVLVADIRQNPNVKNMFRPKDLKQMLEANDMEYAHYENLGNPFYKQHLAEKNPEKAKIEYINYLKTNEDAKKDFRALYIQFRFKKIICLICYCKTETSYTEIMEKLKEKHGSAFKPLKPIKKDDCHRFWLKAALIQAKREFLKIETEYPKILVGAEEI